MAFQYCFLGWGAIGSDTYLGSRGDSWPPISFASSKCEQGSSSASLSLVFLSQCIPSPSYFQWEEGGFQVSLTLCVSSMLYGRHSPIHLCTEEQGLPLAPWPPPQRAGTGLANSLFVPEPQVGVPDERGCVSAPCPGPALPSAGDGVCGKDFGGGLSGFGGGSCLPPLPSGRSPASSPHLHRHLLTPSSEQRRGCVQECINVV